MALPAVNEDLVKGMVDLLVSSGLKKACYEYFVIDGNTTSHMHGGLVVDARHQFWSHLSHADLLKCCHHADAWSNINRDENGRISANSQRFPSGNIHGCVPEASNPSGSCQQVP